MGVSSGHRTVSLRNRPVAPLLASRQPQGHGSDGRSIPRRQGRSGDTALGLCKAGGRMPIAIVFIITALVPTVAAWRKWLAVDQRSVGVTRKILFTRGLWVPPLPRLEYRASALYSTHFGGFGRNFPAFLK